MGVAEEVEVAIPQYRVEHQTEEAALYARIQRLEGLLGHRVLPETVPGEYLDFVKRALNNASDFGQRSYESAIQFETFEIDILEKNRLRKTSYSISS